MQPIPVFFNEAQLEFKPRYEWAFGEKITHPETTARAESILAALQRDPARFEIREPRPLSMSTLMEQHDNTLITLYNTAKTLDDDVTFSPMVFPREKQGRADPTNLHHAGAFCFDSGTPLAAQTFEAALWSAASARNAADVVRKGHCRLSYALSRPPGHHATQGLFGGYCYFNNAGLAARSFKHSGRVAVVDVDFHHGNGTQSLFYQDPQVLTVSIHGDPRSYFPFFAGYPDETGKGPGAGFNQNLVLEEGADAQAYMALLDQHVIPQVQHFAPDALIIAAGFDTYHKDPVGHFTLKTEDYAEMGERLGALGLPTVVVQEGGYYTPHLGRNTVTFLNGVQAGQARAGLHSVR
ncbi:MAG: histone deacetylase family protein [Bradymonadia bacterium]